MTTEELMRLADEYARYGIWTGGKPYEHCPHRQRLQSAIEQWRRYIDDLHDTLDRLGRLVGVERDADKLIAAIERLADADPNADWLSEAHMLCTDAGIPLGHITDRIRALRERLAVRSEPVAWTLAETIAKRQTTTNGHLWFSDPKNSAWVSLYAHPAPQPAKKGSIA